MITLRLTVLAVFALMLVTVPVLAQEAVEESAASGKLEDTGLETRVALAKELHKYISTQDRIEGAIVAVSQQLPEDRREVFQNAMRNVLEYRVIEKISVDTMAELFTVDELEYLIEYNKNPLSDSIDKKFEVYEQRVSPEITRMLDKAMMRVKTGGSRAP